MTPPSPPPPPRLVPWRVPPPGSIGDTWDEWVQIPDPPKATAPAPKPDLGKRREGRRQRRRDDPRDMVFHEYTPPLHPAVIVAWCCVGLSIASTGPLHPLSGIMAGFGLVAAGFGAARILQLEGLVFGKRASFLALAACLILVTTDVIRPGATWYRDMFERPVGNPSRAMAFEEKVARGEADMALFLELAHCASLVNELDAVALGTASVNHRVRPQSEYFRASSLALPEDDIEGTPLANFLFYSAARLPLDPFADDFNATFGAYVTPTHILVYSMGPDGRWSINPRQPIERDDPNPETTLAPAMWLPERGPNASGDWILVGERQQLENNVNCAEVRQRYESRARRGR